MITNKENIMIRKNLGVAMVAAFGLLAATSFLVLQQSASATTNPRAFGFCSGQWYTQDICKYDQSSTFVSAGTLYMNAKGATASGTCDPSNDIQWTKSDGNCIYQNGAVLTGYSGSGQWTNCAMPGGAMWWATRPIDPGNLTIDYFFSYFSTTAGVSTSGLNGHWEITP